MIHYQVDTAIHAGYLLPMDKPERVITGASVLISGDRIVYAGERLADDGIEAAESIHAPQSVILPPFFNQHTHPSLSLYRGLGADLRLIEWLERIIWPLEKQFCSPEMVRLGTKLSLLEMIRSGTGALACMDYFNLEVGQAIQEAGLRGYLGEAVFNDPTPCCPSPEAAMDYTQSLHEAYADSDRIRVYLALHAPYTSDPDLYRKGAEMAARLGIMKTSHVAETERERIWALEQHGMSPVSLLNETGILDSSFVLIHGIHLDSKDIEILAEHDVPVIHNPHSNMVLGSGVCPVPNLLQQGVRVGLGTDSAASNNGLSMMKEMQTMSRLQKVYWSDAALLPAWQALFMATRQGYDIYRYADCGQLTTGKLADLQLVSLGQVHNCPDNSPLSNLAYSSHSEDVTHLMVGGRLIMKDRKVLTLDEAAILGEVREASKDISEFLKKKGIA